MSATAEIENGLEPSNEGAISPELALVDPALAASARAAIIVSDCLVTAGRPPSTVRAPEPATPVDPAATPSPPIARSSKPVRTSRGAAVGLAIGVVLGMAATGFLGAVPVALERLHSAAGSEAPALPDEARGSRAASAPGVAATLPEQPLRFSWAPAGGATAYDVQFFRGSEQVVERQTRKPEFVLESTWRHKGALVARVPGTYRWYVWATRGGVRDAQALVQSGFVVPQG
jgi:hypothetical protein